MGLRLTSASSSASNTTGRNSDEDGVSVCSSDEELGNEVFKTLTALTPKRVSVKTETRGRLPNDSAARAAKKKSNRLRSHLKAMKAKKEKEEERTRLIEELEEFVKGGGGRGMRWRRKPGHPHPR